MDCTPVMAKKTLFTAGIAFLIFNAAALIYVLVEHTNRPYIIFAFTLIGISIGPLAIWTSRRNKSWATMIVIIVPFILGCFAFLITMAALANLKTHKVLSDEYWSIIRDKDLHPMEVQYQCCGRDGPKSYKRKNETIPKTCYGKETPSNKKVLYTTGCRKEVPKQSIRTFCHGVIASPISFFLAVSAFIFRRVMRDQEGQEEQWLSNL